MSTQRIFPRFYQEGIGEIIVHDTNQMENMQVIDISSSGIGIVVEADLEINKTVELKLLLTNQIQGVQLQMGGVIVRKQKRDDGVLYGILFTSLTDKDREVLESLLKIGLTDTSIAMDAIQNTDFI